MDESQYRILVVDDEPKYVRGIQVILSAKGFDVVTASDGVMGVERAARDNPHLILLDVRMPRMDGYEACRRIREFSTAPVIMLTAMAETGDKVKGLELGADDYVTKPFSAEELLARVRAGLRRFELQGMPEPQTIWRAGELQVDFVRHRVCVGEREVSLTATEYRLLCELARQAGRVLTEEYLLDRVWGVGYEGEDRLVWRIIHRLRQKIERDPRNPEYIHTKPGSGYILNKT